MDHNTAAGIHRGRQRSVFSDGTKAVSCERAGSKSQQKLCGQCDGASGMAGLRGRARRPDRSIGLLAGTRVARIKWLLHDVRQCSAAASKPLAAASEVKAAASKPPTAASNAKGAAAVCGDSQHEAHVLVAADRSARRQLQAAAKKRVKPQVSSFARRSLSVEARKRKHFAVENRSKERPVLKRSNAQVDLTADDSNAPVDPGMARPADPGTVAESDMPTEPSTAFVAPGLASPADPGMARLALTDMPTKPGMARPANPVVQMAEQNRTVESGSSVPVARLGSRMLGSRDLALLRARAEGRSDP